MKIRPKYALRIGCTLAIPAFAQSALSQTLFLGGTKKLAPLMTIKAKRE